jgi:hypothetical protein
VTLVTLYHCAENLANFCGLRLTASRRRAGQLGRRSLPRRNRSPTAGSTTLMERILPAPFQCRNDSLFPIQQGRQHIEGLFLARRQPFRRCPVATARTASSASSTRPPSLLLFRLIRHARLRLSRETIAGRVVPTAGPGLSAHGPWAIPLPAAFAPSDSVDESP